VLCSRAYEWARPDRARQPTGAASPPGQLEPRELAEWMLADRLPTRLQVQLHKYLWGGEAGR
jgi:7-carboxy-7-deazaguanine synthase